MQKLNITQEEFLKIIKNIRKQDYIDENFSKALETVCSGYVVYGTENKNKESLIFVLNKLFYQPTAPGEFNTIEWYLYEGSYKDKNEHLMSYNNYNININSDEMLFELLCAEFEQNANNNNEPMEEFAKKYGEYCEGGLEGYNRKETVKKMSINDLMGILKEHNPNVL